jgi:large subunit ribosomal protein L4
VGGVNQVATLKKYNLEGQEIGQIEVADALANAEANGQMIKDYIVALRANARQWSANTKSRSEVAHSTKKPHPQKGGGRARQGMLSAPQYKGGGRVHSPKPKFDQHVRINKKERQAAIRCLIGEKIRENRVHIIDTITLESPKTKVVAQFLKGRQLSKRILFLSEGEYTEIETGEHVQRISVKSDRHAMFAKSIRNLPKTAFSLATNISGYDILVAQDIILTEPALKELTEWLT